MEVAHAHDLGYLVQPAGDLDVLLGRRGVAAAVVMDERDSRRAEANYLVGDVAWVDDTCGEVPKRELDVADLAVLVVERSF